MEITNGLTFDEVGVMLALIESSEQKHEELESEVSNISEVKRPEYIEAVSEWDSYCDQVQQRNNLIGKIKREQFELEKLVKSLVSKLEQNVPPLIWFKIPLPTGEIRWIGVKSSSWGGYNTSLIIEKERPGYILKHN